MGHMETNVIELISCFSIGGKKEITRPSPIVTMTIISNPHLFEFFSYSKLQTSPSLYHPLLNFSSSYSFPQFPPYNNFFNLSIYIYFDKYTIMSPLILKSRPFPFYTHPSPLPLDLNLIGLFFFLYLLCIIILFLFL